MRVPIQQISPIEQPSLGRTARGFDESLTFEQCLNGVMTQAPVLLAQQIRFDFSAFLGLANDNKL